MKFHTKLGPDVRWCISCLWLFTFKIPPKKDHYVIDGKFDIYFYPDIAPGYYQLLPGKNYLLLSKLQASCFEAEPYKLTNGSWFVKTLKFLHENFKIEYVQHTYYDVYLNNDEKTKELFYKHQKPISISLKKLIYMAIYDKMELGQFYKIEDIDDGVPELEFLQESPIEFDTY